MDHCALMEVLYYALCGIPGGSRGELTKYPRMVRVMDGQEVFGPLQMRRIDWSQVMFKEEEEPEQGEPRPETWRLGRRQVVGSRWKWMKKGTARWQNKRWCTRRKSRSRRKMKRSHLGQMWQGMKQCERSEVGERSGGEWSRGGDQVFGIRVTTSTLAEEYVTAREYVEGRGRFRNFGTRTTCRRGA